MILNEHTSLVCKTVTLVPYRHEHVERYHEWMCDPEVRELTASEPLSIKDEYAMQKSWQVDDDSMFYEHSLMTELTFIIAAEGRLIGDVNMFILTDDDLVVGEIEIMIAEKAERGKGYGRTAVLMFMSYIIKHLEEFKSSPTRLQVKIGQSNQASIRLFENIGFKRHKYAEYFREWELHFELTPSTGDHIRELMRKDDRDWEERYI